MDKRYPPTEQKLEELREEGEYPRALLLNRMLPALVLLLIAYLMFSVSLTLSDVLLTGAICAVSAFVASALVQMFQGRFSLGRLGQRRYRASPVYVLGLLLPLMCILLFSVLAIIRNPGSSTEILLYTLAAYFITIVLISSLGYFLSYLRFRQKHAMTKQEILAEGN